MLNPKEYQHIVSLISKYERMKKGTENARFKLLFIRDRVENAWKTGEISVEQFLYLTKTVDNLQTQG